MTCQRNQISRRDLLKSTAVGAVVAGLPHAAAGATVAETAKPGIALQLYSIRDDCRKDFDRSLEEVAKMAFRTRILGQELPIRKALLDKHYLRKHGKNAYYGQK